MRTRVHRLVLLYTRKVDRKTRAVQKEAREKIDGILEVKCVKAERSVFPRSDNNKTPNDTWLILRALRASSRKERDEREKETVRVWTRNCTLHTGAWRRKRKRDFCNFEEEEEEEEDF